MNKYLLTTMVVMELWSGRIMTKRSKAYIKRKILQEREFYLLRSLLGNAWAIFYILLGGRQAGKSYSIIEFFITQWLKYGTPFYWLRLKPKQVEKLLKNNADKLIDPDLRRKYNLNDLVVTSPNVYVVTKRSAPDKNGKTKVLEKKLLATVLPISTFYDDKGVGYFDKDYKGWYNIGVDEFQREANEKNTFDIMYALVNQLENLVRNTKTKVRIFFLGNTLQEASDVLCSFNFIPEEYGRYKLKKKRAVIDYIEPSEAYKKMREGSIADILMPESSTFTNKIDTDYSLVYRGRLESPSYVIKFGKTKDTWYTIWDSNVIKKYNGEKKPCIAMRPYLDEVFVVEQRDNVIKQFDYRGYMFRNLITFKQFQKEIELIKPRK